MSRRRKKISLARAYPGSGNPGGATMFIPANQLQNIFAQTFYGSKAGVPVQDTTMFSPGVPLVPQPGVNKGGLPVQYQFPIAYNSFPVDRSQGKPDIPSFQQLRTVAKLYSGITLCERAWFDMVPRMQLKISLHPDLVAQGYEEKDYQKEISFFRKWFEKPDGRRDIHTWLRMALREQTQLDELYLYKHRKRNGELLGLHIIAGDTMKPLLNDWGDIPLPSDPDPFAYQQYPWGLPGNQYTTDMMVHYQESPAAETPYGQSRIERVLMEVNLGLRKKRRDLGMFTEGNIPAGLMEVPESPMWTPDQIDAFEQSWNALIAGNAQQQVRVKFTQPGMKYIKTDTGEILTEFDVFLLNITTGCYGMSLQDLGFTGDIHKSSGDSQQNVLYRRTIDPLALIYGFIFTDTMHNDFPPALHGEMFIASFGGFEEAEDLGALATAYSTLTGAGILGLTNASKLMKLPEDPDAPHIGRVIITATGPIFLDDMASDEMRNAAQQAQLAGYKIAANPPTPGENPPENGKKPGNGGNIPAKGEQSGKETQHKAIQRAAESDRPEVLQQNTGMMLAFMLDPATAEHLALPGGEPGDNLHVTLAYLGDMNNFAQPGELHPAETLPNMKAILSAFTATSKPIEGNVGGIGRFTPSESSDGVSPIIALINAPGLQEWRRRLVKVLDAAGYHIASDFDYAPHVTLAYVPEDENFPVETLEDMPLLFDTLCLAIGDNRYYFRLGGGNVPPAGDTALPPGDMERARADYKRWRQRALDDVKAGRIQRGFTTTAIPVPLHRMISAALTRCTTAEEVRRTFQRAQEVDANLEPLLDYNPQHDAWEPFDTDQQIAAMQARGVTHLKWVSLKSFKGSCDKCIPNEGQVVDLGKPFKSGARMAPQHPNCLCVIEEV